MNILMGSSNNLFGLEQIEVDNKNFDTTRIFEEIHKEIGEFLTGEINSDSTDGVFDFLENLTNHLLEDFDELIGEGNDKKRFVKALTRIFALLLNTKVDATDKIKRILKIAIEMTLKIWQGPNYLHVKEDVGSHPGRYVKIEYIKGLNEPTPARLSGPNLNKNKWTLRKMETSSRP